MIGTNTKKLVLIVLLLIFFFSVISFPAFSQGIKTEKEIPSLSDEFDIIGHFPDGHTESVKRIEQK